MIKHIKITLTRPQLMELFSLAQMAAMDPGEDEKTAKFSEDIFRLIQQLPSNKLTFYLTPDEAFTASTIASDEGDWGIDGRSIRLADNVYWRVRKAMEGAGIDYMQYLKEFHGISDEDLAKWGSK